MTTEESTELEVEDKSFIGKLRNAHLKIKDVVHNKTKQIQKSQIKKTWDEYEGDVRFLYNTGRNIISNLGNFENNNVFSRVDVGLRVVNNLDEVRKKYFVVEDPPEEMITPYLDEWNCGRNISNPGSPMYDLLEKVKWSDKKQVKEYENNFVVITEPTYRVMLCHAGVEDTDENGIPIKNSYKNGSAINFKGNKKDFFGKFREYFLASYGNQIVYDCRKGKNNSLLGFCTFEKDVCFSNSIIDGLETKCKAYMNAAVGRNILLYGPPGTGKSSIAYSLGKKLGLCLVIRNIEERNAELFDMIEMLDPEVLIIDDLDRVPELEKFLTPLEELRARGKILIATVNRLHKMDSAIIRPGRFDKLMKIDKLPVEIVKSLVEEDNELFELCKDYSVAVIQEVMTRVRVEGKEIALLDLDDLVKRDNDIKKEYANL